MRCNLCSSLMLEVETQKDGRTEQSRYECPTCGRTQLITQRAVMTNRLSNTTPNRLIRRDPHWIEKFA